VRSSAPLAWLLSALASFVLTMGALMPVTATLPEHSDETQYAWTAAYFSGRASRLDVSVRNPLPPPPSADSLIDPGWVPLSFWAICCPMAPRLVYGLALSTTGVSVPALPYHPAVPELRGTETVLPRHTLLVVRAAAVVCVGLGLAAVGARMGWRGVAASALFLAVPHVREDVARAWAEGPLVLALGLCVLSYGRGWFAAACGFAAACKLTALGLWPLLLWRPATGWRPGIAVVSAAGIRTALMPPAWRLYGPGYLVLMALFRVRENASLGGELGGPLGMYLPTRSCVPRVV